MADEAQEMQKEWREEVRDTLRHLTSSVERLRTDLNENGKVYASVERTDEIDIRLTKIEGYGKMIMGAAIVLQVIGGCAIWFLDKIVDKWK